MVDRDNTVYWPIAEDYITSFADAAPYVTWLPLPRSLRGTALHAYDLPKSKLVDIGCEKIVPLYSYLSSHQNVPIKALSNFLKFDEYKYAIVGVPFREKWNLSIQRNYEREEKLYRRVAPASGEQFVVTHLEGSDFQVKSDLSNVIGGLKVVDISAVSENLFDWLSVIERASLRIMIDSCYSNLTEQLNIPGRKFFIPRSQIAFSPVLMSNWQFLAMSNPH